MIPPLVFFALSVGLGLSFRHGLFDGTQHISKGGLRGYRQFPVSGKQYGVVLHTQTFHTIRNKVFCNYYIFFYFYLRLVSGWVNLASNPSFYHLQRGKEGAFNPLYMGREELT